MANREEFTFKDGEKIKVVYLDPSMDIMIQHLKKIRQYEYEKSVSDGFVQDTEKKALELFKKKKFATMLEIKRALYICYCGCSNAYWWKRPALVISAYINAVKAVYCKRKKQKTIPGGVSFGESAPADMLLSKAVLEPEVREKLMASLSPIAESGIPESSVPQID